jgi:hypothetical protein
MSAEISALNRALSRASQSVTVKRRIGTTDAFVSVATTGRVTSFQPAQLSASITMNDSKVILSPSTFDNARTWPGAAGGPRYPRKGDQAVIDGRPRQIENVWPVMIGETVVRLELQVKG